MTSFRRIGLALVAVAALMVPLAVSAAPANNQASFQGGSLSISQPADGTFGANIPISQGSVTANINAASYADATATGNGWNGTVATTAFHIVPTWVTGTGSSPLANQTSPLYTGPATNGSYTVTVTQVTGLASDTTQQIAFTWSGTESGTQALNSVATKNIGGFGVQITFNSTQQYKVGDTYSAKVGNLSASALALSGTTTITGGTGLPVAVGGTSAIVAGASLAMGTPMKFVSASAGTGIGAFTVTPGVTLTWTAGTWAATYVASANYAIVSGP